MMFSDCGNLERLESPAALMTKCVALKALCFQIRNVDFWIAVLTHFVLTSPASGTAVKE